MEDQRRLADLPSLLQFLIVLWLTHCFSDREVKTCMHFRISGWFSVNSAAKCGNDKMVNLLCLCGGAEDVVEMLPDDTDNEVLSDGNDFDGGDGSLYEHYRVRWTHYGDKTAVVDHKTGETLTYIELLETVSRLAGALSGMGVFGRQRVALHGDNSLHSVLAFLALEFLNATVVACKSSLTVREMVYQCTQADVQFIISDEPYYSVALQSLDQLPMVRKVVVANMASPANDLRIAATMEDLLKRGACFEPPDNVHPNEDEVFITFTSGTTGLPKGVLHTHAGLIALTKICGPLGSNLIQSSDVSLQWSPVSHISGNVCFQLGLTVGATNIIGNAKRDVRDASRLCDTYGVTQLLAMPVVLRALIDVLKANPGSLSSLKTVGVGGSVISIPWSKEFLSLIDLESYRIIYGMSECLLASATPDKEKWVTSIGRPMPGVEMKIVDSEGNTLGPHEAGEIAVNAPCNMKGYDKNPKATSEIFIDGWLMTGDCGYMDEEGFFFIKERIKEMIKCMDNQVAPAELEDYLVANHQGVKEVAVIGLPNDEVGEAPTAYVVLNEGVDPSEELRQKLVDMVKEEFATFKQLYGGVFFVTSVPKTDSGKFAKVDLKKQVLAGEYETF